MIKVITSGQRHHADMGWLSTYWHFSFAEYYDPANMNWGALRVFNDDVIRRGQGFGAHPHRDMEIVTYVLEGELEHRDNQGNTGVIHPGEVQVMSAGTGIFHSEYNHSEDRPVRLLQIWILPRTKGGSPAGNSVASPWPSDGESCCRWYRRETSRERWPSIRTRRSTCPLSVPGRPSFTGAAPAARPTCS